MYICYFSIMQLLGGDCKVAVVFLMLTLTSQDSLSQQTKEISNLQTELSLLLFRYLNSKMQAGLAAGRVHALIGCLETMHRSGLLLLHSKCSFFLLLGAVNYI